MMLIGIPKEIKIQEYRVGMVPGGVKSLVQAGHQVLLEKKAGEGSGYSDTEEAPTYILHDVIHYGVSNMPGAVPRTSTQALTNSTLKYIQMIANEGLEHSLENHLPLAKGLNTYCPEGEEKGRVVCEPVAEAQGLECSPYLLRLYL